MKNNEYDEYDDEEDELLSIDDSRVPESLKEHAACYNVPVHYVSFVGENILLLAEDGELVDICAFV